jgi:rhodanese-related sulfurtransferase
MRRFLGVGVLALLLVQAGLALPSGGQSPETRSVPVAGGGRYTDVSVPGLVRLLAGGHVPLVNVHIPYEGEIPGTDAHVPFDRMAAHLDRLPADKGARVVLYCRSGSMSATAARVLVTLGYTDVWNLDGGMIAWERAGQPLVRTPPAGR